MARARDLLYRLRPAGAPGAASATGVPVDRRAAREAELSPLFARLDEVQRNCLVAEEQAQRDAATLLARADQEAQGIVAGAQQRLAEERAAEAERWRARLGSEAADTLGRAEDVARRIRQAGPQRMAEYVDVIVADVDRFIRGLPSGERR